MPLLADQPLNRLIEHHGKSLAVAANHLSRDLKLVVEFENRKLKPDGLPLGDSPPGLDKNPCGTDILDNLPEYPLLDGVLRNNKGRPTGKSAQVWIGLSIHGLIAAIYLNSFPFHTVFFQPRTHSKQWISLTPGDQVRSSIPRLPHDTKTIGSGIRPEPMAWRFAALETRSPGCQNCRLSL
jgi:hypothetical protein